jgi:serine/threonine protein kinase
MPYQIGQLACDRYKILGMLEPQALGALYRAEQTDPQASVLLLEIGAALVPDEAARRQVVRKVGMARGLRATRQVRLLDVHAEGAQVVVAAQSVEGQTLRQVLDKRRRDGKKGMSPVEAWATLKPIAEAVLQLHKEGEVLGDLRAETVFMTADGPTLFNHGVGLSLPRDRFLGAMERSDDMGGIAPEIRESRPSVGARADVFSLAALGYELVFGERVEGAVRDGTPFGQALARALDPEPRERPLNVEAFVRAMEEALAAQPAATPPDVPHEPDRDHGGFGEAPITREVPVNELNDMIDSHGQTTRQINLNEISGLLAKAKGEVTDETALPSPSPSPLPDTEPMAKLTPEAMKTSVGMPAPALSELLPPPSAPDSAVAGAGPPPMWDEAEQRAVSAPPPRRSPLPLLFGAVVVVAGSAAAVWYSGLLGGSSPAPSLPPPRPVAAPAVDAAQPVAAAPVDMSRPLACPDGTAMVPGDKPVCIDLTEFVGTDKLPRTRVSFVQAVQLCGGAGARLCTQLEWERACRGPDSAVFPYGAAYAAARCNTKAPRAKVQPPGSRPECKSAVGALDMSGNVAEWVIVEPKQVPAQKGGSVLSGPADARCDKTTTVSALGGGPLVGFRCCRDPR